MFSGSAPKLRIKSMVARRRQTWASRNTAGLGLGWVDKLWNKKTLRVADSFEIQTSDSCTTATVT